ncbi:hypothetical protein EDC01DRAFT_665804 [Geopyxis carbonaria]|nr:hypothetical protein EDC01DRAFT_665804 [Geopyxis carbonaria]
MPTYIVTVADGSNKQEIKQKAIDAGGEITHDYTLIPAFAVKYPDGHVQALDSIAGVKSVEEDQVVTTQ